MLRGVPSNHGSTVSRVCSKTVRGEYRVLHCPLEQQNAIFGPAILESIGSQRAESPHISSEALGFVIHRYEERRQDQHIPYAMVPVIELLQNRRPKGG